MEGTPVAPLCTVNPVCPPPTTIVGCLACRHTLVKARGGSRGLLGNNKASAEQDHNLTCKTVMCWGPGCWKPASCCCWSWVSPKDNRGKPCMARCRASWPSQPCRQDLSVRE